MLRSNGEQEEQDGREKRRVELNYPASSMEILEWLSAAHHEHGRALAESLISHSIRAPDPTNHPREAARPELDAE